MVEALFHITLLDEHNSLLNSDCLHVSHVIQMKLPRASSHENAKGLGAGAIPQEKSFYQNCSLRIWSLRF